MSHNPRIGWRATAGSVDKSEMIALFQDALQKEIADLKRGRGGKRFDVFDGQRVYSSQEVYVYRFITDQSLTDDTPVSVFIGDQSINGHIISSDPEGINIGLETDKGPLIEQATIHSSAYKLLEKLAINLDKAKSGEISLNLAGSMKLFGFLEPADLPNPISLSEETTEGYTPNTEQKIAILRSLTQEVTFIWGPPGTGKTKTLSVILNQLIRAGKTVLLTSHTNAAVDEILKKFVENDKNKAYIEAGKIIRHGTPSVSNEKFNKLLIDNIIERQPSEQEKTIKKLSSQIDSVNQEIQKLQIVEKEVRTKNNLIETHKLELKKEKKIISNLRSEIHTRKTQNDKITESLSQQHQLLEKSKATNSLKRMLLGLNTERIERDITALKRKQKILKLELQSHESELKESEEERIGIENKITQLTNQIEKIIHTEGLTSIDSLKKRIHKLTHETKEKQNEMERVQTAKVVLKEDIFRDALVVGCTLTRAYLDSKVPSRKFDVLIIDEASMATLPNVFFVGGIASNHYIISGDFRQLPPIAVSSDKSAAIWLKRDIFKQAGIVQSVDQRIDDKRVAMLKAQYRMHSDICALISDLVYQGQLKTPENVKMGKQRIASLPPIENKALIFCDTSKANPRIIRSSTSRSRLSPYSAAVSARLASKLVEEGRKKRIEINVGIVTPYRAQARLISKILEDEHIKKNQVVASTIHKFQGNERECIVFDLVEGQPFPPGILTKGPFIDSEPGRLINVAISRAEGKFILVGNGNYILNKFSVNDAVFQIMEEIKKNGETLDSLSILSTSFDSEIKDTVSQAGRQLSVGAISILNEKNFYDVFREDLKIAKSSVVIFSPFIARKRLRTIKKDFINSLKRGIKIYIVTRYPDYQGSNRRNVGKLIEEIRETGAEVVIASEKVGFHAKFHDKIAVVDDSVFYHGSMNILSQSNSSESMIAFRSRKTINELVKIFGIKRIIRNYQNLTGEDSSQSSIIRSVGELLSKKKDPGMCPQCGTRLVLIKGSRNLFFGCPNLSDKNCDVQKEVDKILIKQLISSMKIKCEKCKSGYMVYREGEFSPFLGCDQYYNSECRGKLEFDARAPDLSSRENYMGRLRSKKQVKYAKFVEELKQNGIRGKEFRERMAQWNKEHEDE